MNARFWCYVNDGDVKLTLTQARPTLSWGKSWRHEEGWSSQSEEWELQETGVIHRSDTDGTDCDGRLSTSTELYCPFDKLSAFQGPDGTLFPDWTRLKSGQRDYSAEAMGY